MSKKLKNHIIDKINKNKELLIKLRENYEYEKENNLLTKKKNPFYKKIYNYFLHQEEDSFHTVLGIFSPHTFFLIFIFLESLKSVNFMTFLSIFLLFFIPSLCFFVRFLAVNGNKKRKRKPSNISFKSYSKKVLDNLFLRKESVANKRMEKQDSLLSLIDLEIIGEYLNKNEMYILLENKVTFNDLKIFKEDEDWRGYDLESNKQEQKSIKALKEMELIDNLAEKIIK